MASMSRRDFLAGTGRQALAAASLSLLPGAGAWAAGARRKPNIIFFLVDDMGWMDSTVYGSQYYETPNMERLAKRSMMFTDAYAANPLCSPTRASILTGKYPARLHITTPTCHLKPRPAGAPEFPEKAAPGRKVLLPISRRFLPPEEYTIAEALHDAGYSTCHIGKWHLGLNPEHWPNKQGFDVKFHGAPDPGPRSYFSPYQFRAGNVTDGPDGEYITDRVTDEALKFMTANRDRPFLLHLWQYAVHGPWGHKEEITRRFAAKKDPRGKQDNPIMASMLKSVDQSLGRVLDKLDELGIADETIIIFFSDNGGNIHSNSAVDRKRAPVGSRRWKLLQDWRRWAGQSGPTNNAPLRGGKASIFEGGHRVPMMVAWPGVVAPGSRCSEVVSSIDFYPTMLAMAGARPKPGQVIDGLSLMPVLQGKGKIDREAVFCHFPHGFGQRSPASTSVRKGDWKLIRVYDTSEWFPDEHMLYNLKDDLGETTNLAAKLPDKVKELDALIDRFLADTKAAVPRPNPNYDPSQLPVRGWRPQTGTKIELADGVLHVRSEKTRPFIQTRDVPRLPGEVVVKLRMRATGGKGGRVYWGSTNQPRFVRERRVDIKPTYDGQWHEYEARFKVAGALSALRIDPSLVACEAALDWVRVCKPDGTVVKAWEFQP